MSAPLGAVRILSRRSRRVGKAYRISSHVRYASDRYRNGEALKPTRRAQAVWKGVGMRGIVSATPISRSWGTDLNRTGSLTAPDAPWGVCSH